MFHVPEAERQVSVPAGEYSYPSVVTPEPPPSSAFPESGTVRRRFAPGLPSVTVGGVLSTRIPVTGTPSPSLPATSSATVRKS